MNPFLVMVLGMGTVFLGLVCIILLSKLMSLVIRGLESKAKGAVKPQKAEPTISAGAIPPAIPDRGKLDAVISAALATYMGGEVSGLRIRSLKRISGSDSPDRGQFVAAVAAAVATSVGTDVSGLRIHKITKI